MRCGRERHLHGHLLVAPAGAYATVSAASCRPIVHQQYERCAMQTHAGALFRRLTLDYVKSRVHSLSYSILNELCLPRMSSMFQFFSHSDWFSYHYCYNFTRFFGVIAAVLACNFVPFRVRAIMASLSIRYDLEDRRSSRHFVPSSTRALLTTFQNDAICWALSTLAFALSCQANKLSNRWPLLTNHECSSPIQPRRQDTCVRFYSSPLRGHT